MNEDKRAATGTRSGIRCAGCGAPFLRRRELVLAVNWFIRLRTYCPACFDETQHKGGWEKLLRTNCRISRFWVLIGLLPFVSVEICGFLFGSLVSLVGLSLFVLVGTYSLWILILRLWAYFRVERPLIKGQRERAHHPYVS